MVHPVDTHVGQRIRQHRILIGMTQQELARAAGVNFQQIQKYETGKNRVSSSRLWAISVALEVTIDFFFEGLEEEERQHFSESTTSHDEVMVLIRSYYAIPEAKRKSLLNLARVLGDHSI